MLQFKSDWRFDSPDKISRETLRGLWDLIKPIIRFEPWSIYEHFKEYFANAIGQTASRSSSESWAETDVGSYMSAASENAPVFIEAFYDACEALPEKYPKPGVERINKVLAETDSDWRIELPNLVRLSEVEPVPMQWPPAEELPQHLDATEQDVIQASLSKSQQLLSEGSNRLAVQEIIWLLETVSTVFKGVQTDEGSVQGKYFNTIITDLRRLEKGKTLERVLDWIDKLHGYLSSPSGGGIRHGATLADATPDIEPNEARLYCNLIRSYIMYLLTEHRRLTGS